GKGVNGRQEERQQMIAQELEVSLHMAFVEARQKRHEFITVEHLLLALLDNPTAAEVLRACGANMDELRKNLTQHIAEQTPRIAADREVDTQPTLGFQRVIQRAILHVQDRALDDPLEAQGRLGVDLAVGSDARGLLGDVLSQVLAQLVHVGAAGAQHFGRGGVVEQRKQQVFDGDELVALLARLDERHVEADFKLLGNHLLPFLLPAVNTFSSAFSAKSLPSRTATGAGASGSMPRLAAPWW